MSSSDETYDWTTDSDDEICDDCYRDECRCNTDPPECPHPAYEFVMEEHMLCKRCFECSNVFECCDGRSCPDHMVYSFLKKPDSLGYLLPNYPLAEECSCDHGSGRRCQHLIKTLGSLTLYDRCMFEIKFVEDRKKAEAKEIFAEFNRTWFAAERDYKKSLKVPKEFKQAFLEAEEEYLLSIDAI